MLFDKPEDDVRFNEAIHTLLDLAGNDTGLIVLVTFVRTFFEVKREREERQEQRRNKVIKLKPADN